MINEEFKAQGTKYQVLLDFGICCRELGGLKLLFGEHACADSAQSISYAFFIFVEKK